MICHIDYKDLSSLSGLVNAHCKIENGGNFIFLLKKERPKSNLQNVTPTGWSWSAYVDCVTDKKFKTSHKINSLPKLTGCFCWAVPHIGDTINILSKQNDERKNPFRE